MKSLEIALFTLTWVAWATVVSANTTACVNRSSGKLKVARCNVSDNDGCRVNETCISLGGGTGYQLVCTDNEFPTTPGQLSGQLESQCPQGDVALGCTVQPASLPSFVTIGSAYFNVLEGETYTEPPVATGCFADWSSSGTGIEAGKVVIVTICATCETAP
jgi:hypothetical protein